MYLLCKLVTHRQFYKYDTDPQCAPAVGITVLSVNDKP